MTDWLPLFPLGQPLFPGLRLDLQIFEQRYLKLIRSSMRENSGFGVCVIYEGREVGAAPSIDDCGVQVKIVDWNQCPAGLLGMTVEAKERFWVGAKEVDPDGLLRSEIKLFEEEIDESIPDWASGLVEVYKEMLFHPGIARRLPAIENIRASGLGWGLAQVLPMALNMRMDCLRTKSASDRLDRVAEQIQVLADTSNSLNYQGKPAIIEGFR